MTLYSYLADLVVLLHGAYVAFVVFGQFAILLGWLLRWEWIRNFRFRALHLSLMLIVVVEAAFNITCPLTTLEHSLRMQAGESVQAISFMGRLAQDFLFYDLPAWVFRVLHGSFGALVVLTFVVAPPRRWRSKPRKEAKLDRVTDSS